MNKGYYISRQPKTGEIVYINYDKYKGYNIAPKNKVKYDGIRVNKMILVKPSMIEKVLKRKIKHQLDLYLKTIIDLMEESSDEGSSGIRGVLNDLTRFKNILKYKYEKHLEEQYIKLLNKKIEVLEYELKKKLMVREEKNIYKDMYDAYMKNLYLNSMYANNYEDVDEMTSHRRR